MRSSSIDLLRTVSIFIMVFVHFTVNLSGTSLPLAGLAAPMFMTLAGVSYRLWLNGASERTSETEISRISVRRGLFLFGVGIAFNVLVWLPEDTFNWDVLTLIGFGLIALNLARRVPRGVVVLFCVLVFLISPVCRAVADWPAYWKNGYFDHDWTLPDILQGFLVVGYFPVFPWIIFPLVGFLTGTAVFGESCAAPRSRRAVVRGLWTGLGLILASAGLLLIRELGRKQLPATLPEPWSMFPPSFEYVLMMLGTSVGGFCAGQLWLDRLLATRRLIRVRGFVELFSRHSLTIYVLHHVAHLWPLWIYGAVWGEEPTQFWRLAMSTKWAVVLASGFLLSCYFGLRWLEHTKRKGIEGWMRSLCG
jgi:uncharacterized membrane protein